ncbi:MAG: amino acid permease [Myxococcota bacterium]
MSDAAPDAYGDRLPRKLGLASGIAVVVGSTIGSGIFRTPAAVAERIDSLWFFAAAWILGSVVALAGALTYAELSAMMPRTGGVYVYVREAFGKLPAFLFGWAQLLILRPAAYGAIAITSAEYLWRCFGIDGSSAAWGGPLSIAQITAIGMVALVGMLNVRGVELGAFVQNTSTVLKSGALLLLIVLGLVFIASGRGEGISVAPASSASTSMLSAFGLAMIPVLWSYDGWSDVGYVSGEIKDPARNLPRAFILGTAAVGGLYLAVNAAYLFVVPLHEMPGRELIAADVASAVMGSAGVVFVSAAVAVSTFGTLNGSMMTGPRIFFAMAEDGLFFERLAKVEPRFGTPAASIVLAVVLGGVFVSVRTFAQLADAFVIGIWPFYALGVLAIFVLRKRQPDRERPYRAWGYPWLPIVFLGGATFVLGNYLVTQPMTFLGNVAVILTGVPVYLYWSKRNARRASADGDGDGAHEH